MVIILKSRKQIEMMHEAGRIVADTFVVLHAHIRPGMTTAELDQLAEEYIRSRGADPVYKGYGGMPGGPNQRPRKPFPSTICASVNDVICHGIPDSRIRLHQGDIVGVDIGVRYKGWVGDSCVTFAVGQVSPDVQRLLDVAEHCLNLGIEQARVGRVLADIGFAIQTYAESQGFSVVREYTGHGVGQKLHEEPSVLHYYEKGKSKQRLVPGMVFTIEPMINAGKPQTRQDGDGWTVRTIDGSWSAQFEHQLAITEEGPLILTR